MASRYPNYLAELAADAQTVVYNCSSLDRAMRDPLSASCAGC